MTATRSRRAALTASLALAIMGPFGCCEIGEPAEFPERFTWRWRTGGDCFRPGPEHQRALSAGIALWSEWGVQFEHQEADDRGQPDLELCLLARHPRPSYAAWTSHTDGEPALVELNGLIAPAATPALYAHELGHVVLYPGTGHHPGAGILAPYVTLRLDWSPDDADFLAGLGFESR